MAKTYTPSELAAALKVDPKALRRHLRDAHTRQTKAKGTNWTITQAMANECRKHFAGSKPKAVAKPKPKAKPKARKAATPKPVQAPAEVQA